MISFEGKKLKNTRGFAQSIVFITFFAVIKNILLIPKYVIAHDLP